MNVFITGATGYIGGSVAEAIDRAGHGVLALARSDEAEAIVRKRGWTPVRGDLRDAGSVERAAARSDAVIHAANTGGDDAATIDTAATRAVLRALDGTDRPFVYTSGVWVFGSTGPRDVDETTEPETPTPAVIWRPALEQEVLRATAGGVRSVVLRPGVVYGRGGGIPGMIVRGELPLVGDGRQRWPLVHVDDLADLYVRALDAPAGSILHGVAGSAAMVELSLAGRLAAGGTAEPERLSLEEARVRLGHFADALALDQSVRSERTRQLVGWAPEGAPPIEELLAGSYRTAAAA